MRLRRLTTFAISAAMVVPVAVATSGPAAADTTISTRVDDTDPVGVAVEVSRLRFLQAGSPAPRHVVLARDDDFADSLSATGLTGDGPLLFTATDALTPETAQHLAALGSTLRVYVVGGTAAISEAVVQDLRRRGHEVVRLRGTDRIGTSIEIARQVRRIHGASPVLLARARGLKGSPGSAWADSVAGGAFASDRNWPILLTDTAAMDSRVATWLTQDGTKETHLLGGTAALSAAVFKASPGAQRHSGADRTSTAVAVATELWGTKNFGARRFTVIDAKQDRGWAFGLAAAGLAADNDAPVLSTIAKVTPATRRMVARCGEPEVDITIVGDGTLVSGAVREYLDDLDGQACGPDRTLQRRAALTRFADCAELVDWYRTNALERVTAYGLGYWYGGGPFVTEDRAGEPMPVAAPSAEADGGSASSGDEVSTTNNQETGVDEPDILKTDGRILAVVNGDRIDLVDLTGLTPRLASSIQLDGFGTTELLLTGGVLTALRSNNFPMWFAQPAREGDFAPQSQPTRVTTTVTRWDVTAPDAAVELSTFEMDGWYRSARMVDGVARIVVESGPHDLDFTYPQDGSQEAHDRALEHNRGVVKTSTLQNWLPSWTAKSGSAGQLLVECSQVHQPPAWSGFDGITVVTYDTRTASKPGAAATVVAQGQNVYASTKRLVVTTGRWGETFEDENLDSVASTELHAFDITSPTDVAYTGSGSVDGFVLNQFSLSEFGETIRVAATKQPPWRNDQEQTESFVAVLAEGEGKLVEISRVGGLGLGERIQSVRFLGDLGLVVTFRQVDPLYLIDLSDPLAPKVTGELKDTGFAQYLHRVGDDLIMGVGVDATDEGQTIGAMIALYDIADRTKPTRVSRLNIPDAYSPVGNDHKAFLHWATTDDAFIPMSQYGQQQTEQALVMHVDDASRTMSRRGALTHQNETRDQPWQGQIRRTFIVGSNAYTISFAGLARHDIATLATTSFTAWPGAQKG